jgi:uncharacterized protein (TIRG00374 family)
MKSIKMKHVAIFCTIVILGAIYYNIDLQQLAACFLHLHVGYFALALFLFVPQILSSSLRWYFMVRSIRPISFMESTRLVMGSKALNALVPSKLGEMSKGYFLKKNSPVEVDTNQCISAVILEKIFDLSGLYAILLIGVCVIPEKDEIVWLGAAIAAGGLVIIATLLHLPLGRLGEWLGRLHRRLAKVEQLFAGWEATLAGWREKRGRLAVIFLLSLMIWGLHFAQMYLFFPSLRQWVPLSVALALLPLAILVGLLPFTIGGMGTRDTALILLFSSYADPAIMAGIGLLCSMRYWVDTLLGVPFFHDYISRMDRDPAAV